MKGAKLRTPEGDCLTISQIDGGGATMVNSKGKSTHVALHVLADDFKVAAAEQQVILPIIAPSPLDNYELIAEQRKSKVRVALCSAFDITSVGATDLAIFNRPSKAVFAGKGFTAGKLALVPLSPIVGIAAKGKVPRAAISVGDSFEHGGVSLQAFTQAKVEVPSELPSASGCSDKKPNPFVVPFWLARSSDIQSHCNMEMGTIDIMLTTTSKAISIETLVRIPVMRNTHSVKANGRVGRIPREGASVGARRHDHREACSPRCRRQGTAKGKGQGQGIARRARACWRACSHERADWATESV